MRQMTTSTIWICRSSCTKRVFKILREVGAMRKVCIKSMTTLSNEYLIDHCHDVSHEVNTRFVLLPIV